MIKTLKKPRKLLDSTIQNNLLIVKKQYIPLQSDLFIVEFPKSGITWLSNIIANIEIITSSESSDDKKSVTFGNLESFISDIYCGYPSNYYSPIFAGRLLKSHEKSTPDIHRLIYLYRHPIAVMKSYYRMCKGYQIISKEMTFSEFIRNPELGVAAWKEHVRNWLFNSKESQRIFFVSYESLIDNTSLYVEKIYHFFGIHTLPKHIINEAVEMSSANNMRMLEEQLIENDLRYKVRYANNYRFIKGNSGQDFENEEESEKYIYLQCLEELRWLGYES